MANNKNFQSHRGYFDYTLLITVLCLLIVGLLMIYSTSSVNYGMTYVRKQAVGIIFGAVLALVTTFVDYHVWRRLAIPGAFVAAGLVLMVLSPLGMTINGAKRWIRIGSMSLQPAEVVKLEVILLMATLIVTTRTKTVATVIGKALLVSIPAIYMFLILGVTSNASSAIIVIGIAAVMIYVADPKHKIYLLVVMGVAAIGGFLIYLGVNTSLLGYRGDRIKAWLDPTISTEVMQDSAYQTLQALYAIGSGGYFGKGLGNSLQKLGDLPEAQNDMIFAIICEELGMFGAGIVIFLFAALIFRCYVIIRQAPDLFGAMIVVGVMAQIAIQVILNICVVTNLIPNTGVSLPFISYGGTSVMLLMAEIGLVFNVSLQIPDEEV